MADVKISELPSGTASTDDTLVVVDGGVTKKITVGAVTALATKADVGLGNADNTTDSGKPVSTAQQTALNLKVSKNSSTGAASMPTGTTAQRPTGALGMFRHNSTLDQFEGYNDGAWGEIGGGGGGPSLGTDSIIRVNNLTISENITIPSTSNGFSAGPITIADGYTVTVNGTWSII
jgi:hypothetical protein